MSQLMFSTTHHPERVASPTITREAKTKSMLQRVVIVAEPEQDLAWLGRLKAMHFEPLVMFSNFDAVQRMTEDLELKNHAPSTRSEYVRCSSATDALDIKPLSGCSQLDARRIDLFAIILTIDVRGIDPAGIVNGAHDDHVKGRQTALTGARSRLDGRWEAGLPMLRTSPGKKVELYAGVTVVVHRITHHEQAAQQRTGTISKQITVAPVRTGGVRPVPAQIGVEPPAADNIVRNVPHDRESAPLETECSVGGHRCEEGDDLLERQIEFRVRIAASVFDNLTGVDVVPLGRGAVASFQHDPANRSSAPHAAVTRRSVTRRPPGTKGAARRLRSSARA